MKNKLIIITSSIGRMGGAQMYVENKVSFFQSKGWEVFVFYVLYAENILLPGLEKFRNNYIPELNYPIKCIPEYYKRKIISKIKKIVKPENSMVIIESQLVGSSYWGEIIAERFHARHVLNLLEEQIPAFNEKEFSFFEYKLKQCDILNASLPRLRTIFKDRFKEDYKNYTKKVSIPCANVVSAEVEDNYQFEKCDYTILSIGRIDKPYIPSMNDEVIKFASMVSNKNINIVYIGGSQDGIMERLIPQSFEGIDNIRCYILGYVYPIPLSLVKRANVAIACANSVLVTSNEGIPTIVVDMNDHTAIGIYGYTTTNMFKRGTEKIDTVSNLLNKILVKKELDNMEPVLTSTIRQEKAFEDDLTYYLSKNNSDYYNVISIYSLSDRFLSKTKYLIKKTLLGR